MQQTRWKCQRSADFALRDWSDGSVIFDEANGQLHYLNASAGMLIRLVLEKGDGQWSSNEMAQELLDAPPTAEDIHLVDDVLSHFLSLKLIERSQD